MITFSILFHEENIFKNCYLMKETESLFLKTYLKTMIEFILLK